MALTDNGKWTLSTVIQSLMLAILTGLAIWLAREQLKDIEFRARGDRWTESDAYAQSEQLKAWVQRERPPKWLIDRLDRLEKEHERMFQLIDKLCQPSRDRSMP